MQVGSDPVPGPPGLFLPSSEAESVSAEEIRLDSARFPAASSTNESIPPRPRRVLRAVSFDERTYELDGGPDSLETELAPEYDEEEDEEGSDDEDDLEGSGQEDESETDSLRDGANDQQMESDDHLDTFNRLASQMLDRLEKAEQKTQMLELQLRARDDLPDKAPAPRETGYVPLPDKPQPGLDPEMERLVLMTP